MTNTSVKDTCAISLYEINRMISFHSLFLYRRKLAVAVLNEFVQPSILCGPMYVKSHLGNIEPNLNQVFFAKMTHV